MFDPVEHLAELREAPTEALEHAYRQLDALESGASAHKLLVLSVLDERAVGREDGAFDTADWVARTSRLAHARARALVDTARGLRDRPALTRAALEGRLSGDQLEPAVQLATSDTDAQWAEDAPGMSPAALRRARRRRRAVTNDEALAAQARSCVRTAARPEKGVGRICATLAYDDYARVLRSLERTAEQSGPEADGTWAPLGERLAGALVDVCSARLAADADADRACLYLHVTETGWAEGSERVAGELTDVEMPVAAETARRLGCDATVRTLVEDEEGVPLRLGRRRRTVPPHLFRLLKQRDRHCQFPGCTRTRGLHAHHRVHFVDGGTTDLDNLVLLCTRHHRFVHEGKWKVCTPECGDHFVFHRPDGSVLSTGPPALAPRVGALLQPD